jgi:RHS repeat-associated protein
MNRCSQGHADAERLVGDPVDVTTGALTDRTLDFKFVGPFPLEWRRYYDSSKVGQCHALGWGHTHEYDHQLLFDVDGLRYCSPVGAELGFPPLKKDGDIQVESGLTLERISESTYCLYTSDGLTYEFHFQSPSRPARLAAVRRGISRLLFRYEAGGHLVEIVDASQRRISVSCDNQGRIKSLVLRPQENETERRLLLCGYDVQGNLARFVDPYGHAASFRYDDRRRMISRTDRRGFTFYFEYDSQGRCIRSAGEDGTHEVKLRYLTAERVTVVTHADGGEWTYFFDDSRRITQIIDPLGGVKQFIRDPDGQVTEVMDADGDVWRRLRSRSGAVIGELDPCGRLHASARAALRKQREEIALPDFISPVADRLTVFMGRVPVSSGHTHFYSNPFRWEFGDLLAIHSTVRPMAEHLLASGLPDWARPSVIVRDLSATTGEDPTTLPTLPFISKAIFPPGIHTHDFLGTLARTKDVDGAIQEWIYDPNGNIVQYRDADRQVWRYEYASWDQLAREISPAGRIIEYAHTRAELLSLAKDPGGSVGQFRYDLRGRLSETQHAVLRRAFEYQAIERQVVKRDAAGRKRLMIHQGPGNLPREVVDDGGQSAQFQYTLSGLCLAAENQNCRAEFAYDEWENLIADRRDGEGVQRQFDAFDLISTVVFERFFIRYDRKPGLLMVVDPTGKRHEFKFLGHGLVLKTLSNRTEEVSQYQYEGRCLMKVLRGGAGTQRVWSRQYFCSRGGQLIRVEDNQEGRAEYSYDPDGRLMASEALGRQTTYTHDTAGNLSRKPGLADAMFRQANQMISANGAVLRYDEQGCLASVRDANGEAVYRHDAMGWLVECSSPHGRWEAKYDALGRRISKSFQGSQTEFYWDGERLAAEVRDGKRLRVYVYVHHRARMPFMFVDYADKNAAPQDGKCFFIFTNQLGAPVRIEDQEGATVWQARYEPFGETQVRSKAGFEPFHLRFPGHHADPETGLHYNRFRYYNPAWGRYLEPDPLDVTGGLNQYAYTSNPLSEVDVDGRCPKKTPPLDPNEDSKERAARMAARIRNELDQNPNEWGFTPHDNITYAVMVVRMADGSRRMVVTANGNRQSLHSELDGVVASDRFVAPENNPPGDTGHHAEQRAMAWARENSTNPDPSQRVEAIEAISPTRGCCQDGCCPAIQRRGDPNLDVVQTPSGVPKIGR